MTATIHRFPPPSGYSLWGSCDMDGKPIWFVDLCDSDGVVHEQWQFNTKAEADTFAAAKRGGAHAGLPPQCA
ncbi:hypothetical protein [Kaistia granuli]|uniref:hypothetical protein n=1 Tax=Kaistia granuli TaxID=363259 RepID=UPI00036B2112|nr:hypothetical protein [Kaistia granuli]